MSELKEVHAFDVYEDYTKTGDDEQAQVYLKSEADKVIEDKDAKILALDAEVFKQKHHAKLFFDERNYAETQLRRQKYKRCMAKAEACMHKRWRTDEGFDYARSTRHMKSGWNLPNSSRSASDG